MAALAARLHTFKGISARVENGEGGGEFANELRSTFKLASWRTNEGDVIGDPQRFAFEGIKVLVHDAPLESDDMAVQAADALVQELRRQNFVSNRQLSDAGAQANFIRIRIGSR